MDAGVAVWTLLLMAAVAANLPFFNDRLFLVGPPRPGKSFAWRLLEWAVYCTAATAAARAIESGLGQAYAQGWAFYAVLVCLYLTLAFPGFVWRHLRRQRAT
jgi:hypothetical protein